MYVGRTLRDRPRTKPLLRTDHPLSSAEQAVRKLGARMEERLKRLLDTDI